MIIREHANTLLALLGEKLQGEIPLLDEMGACVFLVDGVIVHVALAEELEYMVFSALVGRLPDGETREEAMRQLARGNFHWGGTDGGVLGFEEETDLVFLHRKHFLPFEKTGDFIAAFARQIGLAKYWGKALSPGDQTLSPTALRV